MDNKRLTKAQKRKLDARVDYEKTGLTINELIAKYGYAKSTLKGYISREGWQKQPQKDLGDTQDQAERYLSLIFNEDMDALKSKLFGKDTSDEIDEIENLATVMLAIAKGSVSVAKKTFLVESGDDGDFLKEKFREVTAIRPDPRAGQFFLELSEKLATMVDVGEFETDAELEERYRGYYEKAIKQGEEFANRINDE